MKSNYEVTIKERQDVPFTLMGEQIKVKIADLDAIIIQIREQRKADGLSNVITILPSRERKYVEPNYMPTYVRDPINSVFYGIVIGWHPDGNPKWSKIPLREFLELDLSRDHDCKIWAVLRMHPEVNISPLRVEDPKYIVMDPEVEASKDLSRATLIGNVLAKCKTMKKEDIKYFARWLDIPLNGTESSSVIRAKLTKVALNNPEFFQEKLNDQNRNVGEIFKSAKMVGVIKHDAEKGYKYNDIWLGLTDFECLEFLGRENTVVTSMKVAVENIDKQAAPTNDTE